MPNDDDVTEITSLKALMKLENLLIKSEFQVDSIRWCVICDIHPKFCMSLGVWQGQFSVAFYFNIDFFSFTGKWKLTSFSTFSVSITCCSEIFSMVKCGSASCLRTAENGFNLGK